MPGIIDVILPTFIVIFIGFILGKRTKLSIAPVAEIILYIGVPALIFTSLLSRDIVLLDAGKVWAASITIIFSCGITAWIVFRILRQKHSGLYVSISIMNTLNIPFPIIYLAYGAEGLIAATLFHIPVMMLIYSLGLYIMAGKRWTENIREVFKTPMVYAAVLGLVFNLFRIHVFDLIMNTLSFIAMMAIPLVLLVLGYNLSKVSMKSSIGTTVLASFLRIGVGLGIGMLIVNVFNIQGIFRSVVVLDSAMPAAAMTTILSTKYRNEAELVSGVVFLTTLVSLASIPLLLHFLS